MAEGAQWKAIRTNDRKVGGTLAKGCLANERMSHEIALGHAVDHDR